MQALIIPPDPPSRVRFVRDYPDPRPAAGEVLVRVHLAGICATDLELARGYLRFAGVPGHEFVGTVVGGPAGLAGRRIVADINCPCGTCDTCRQGRGHHCPRRTVLGIAGRDGAFAEYLAVPAANCHLVADGLSDAEAVFAEPLAAAAHVLDALPIDRATRVTVLGSGRLGLLVAEVLAGHGCDLQVVGRNPATLARCAARGIRTRAAHALAPAADQDVVVECTGAPEGLRLALRLCRPCGTVVLKSTYAGAAPLDLAPLVIHEIRLVGSRCGDLAAALRLLAERRVELGGLVTGEYPLERGVEALAAAAAPEHIKVLLRPPPP